MMERAKGIKVPVLLNICKEGKEITHQGGCFREAPALFTNIRLAQESLPRANSLAP